MRCAETAVIKGAAYFQWPPDVVLRQPVYYLERLYDAKEAQR